MAGRRRAAGAGTLAGPVSIDGVLVRHLVGDGHWAEHLPPVPAGFTVTVSFGCIDDAAEHGDALGLLGYYVLDAAETADAVGSPNVDFLVCQRLIEAHPAYCRSLSTHAWRVYHLSLGPAAAAVADTVAAHARALST